LKNGHWINTEWRLFIGRSQGTSPPGWVLDDVAKSGKATQWKTRRPMRSGTKAKFRTTEIIRGGIKGTGGTEKSVPSEYSRFHNNYHQRGNKNRTAAAGRIDFGIRRGAVFGKTGTGEVSTILKNRELRPELSRQR